MIRVADKNHRGKYSAAKTGVFYMRHPEKYCGTETPVFKSSLELNCMRYMDKNPAIVKWGYETAAPIKYLDRSTNPPKVRRYYVDFVCHVRIGTQIKVIWIEVKPKSETVKPKSNCSPKTMMTWVKNSCKWAAARQLAKQKGYDFKILTEAELT